MLRVRALLAGGLIVAGAFLCVRILAAGFSPAVAPGLVLGILVMMLGVYRLRQIRDASRGRR